MIDFFILLIELASRIIDRDNEKLKGEAEVDGAECTRGGEN